MAVGTDEEDSGCEAPALGPAPEAASDLFTPAVVATPPAGMFAGGGQAGGASASSGRRSGELRVVFLNINGVLNAHPDARQLIVEGGPAAQLLRLLDTSGAQLVLATSWREHREYFAQVLANFGFIGADERSAIECTPRHGDGFRRDLEILHWLGARRGQVDAWVVLDASAELLSGDAAARFDGHVLRVSPGVGLQADDVSAALRILGCPAGDTSAHSRFSCAAVGCAGASGYAAPPPEGVGPTLEAPMLGLPAHPAAMPEGYTIAPSEAVLELRAAHTAWHGPSKATDKAQELIASAKVAGGTVSSVALLEAELAARMEALLGPSVAKAATPALGGSFVAECPLAAVGSGTLGIGTVAVDETALASRGEFDKIIQNARQNFK